MMDFKNVVVDVCCETKVVSSGVPLAAETTSKQNVKNEKKNNIYKNDIKEQVKKFFFHKRKSI